MFEDIPDEALNYLNDVSFESLSLDDNKSENNYEVKDVQNSFSTLQKDNNSQNIVVPATITPIFPGKTKKF